MKLFDWMKGRKESPAVGASWGWGGNVWGQYNAAGDGEIAQTLSGKLHLNAIVGAGASYLGAALPQAPLIVQRKVDGKWETVENHPFAELWNGMLNPDYPSSVAGEAMAGHWLTGGNCYLMLWGGRGGDLSTIHVVNPRDIRPRDDGPKIDGQIVTHYEYDVPGEGTYNVPPQYVAHLRRGIDPYDRLVGHSPLQAAIREIYGDNKATVYHAALADNFGTPPVLLTLDPSVSSNTGNNANQLGLLQETMKQHFSGKNAGRPGFLPMPLKVEKIGYSPKDLDLGPISDRTLARICAAMGFDPMVLGYPSANKTYSNLQEAENASYRRVVVPAHTTWGQQLTQSVLRRWYGETDTRVSFDYSGVPAMQDDLAALHSVWHQAFLSGLITAAEYREKVGLEPKPGDEDRYYSAPGAMPEDEDSDDPKGDEDEDEETVDEKALVNYLRRNRAKLED